MRRDDRGVSALEMCIWAIPLLGIAALLAMMAQFPMAKLHTTAAANDAARAASLQRDSASASQAANAAALAALQDAGRSCTNRRVSVDISSFNPGGNVSATVTCVAQVSDLMGIGLPGSKTFTSTADSPVDRYRESR